MLIEFRVENHRSIRDEQVLTMEAGNLRDEEDRRPREISVSGKTLRLLPAAVLYGANASGKSNVLAALGFMRHAVIHSHRSWDPDEGVPRDPFAWGEKTAEPSMYEATFAVEGIRYRYGFAVDDEQIVEEWLYAWPHGKKQVWLERDVQRFKFGEHLKGENRIIEVVTRKNALFLAAAVQHKHSQLQPLYRLFRSLRMINMNTGIQAKRAGVSGFYSYDFLHSYYFSDTPKDKRMLGSLLKLIKASDVGIEQVRIQREPKLRFFFRHHGNAEDAWLPLEQESHGTQRLFRLARPILDCLENGSLLVIDELESSLHPLLAQHVVQLFNNPETNPHNAQLIFATHDTNLLGTTVGEPVLRRDQIWFTEKDENGGTVLYPLTDFKPRKAENLERGYLQGRYGAIPFLGDFDLLGAPAHA